MHLVGGHRRPIGIARRALGHPVAIGPWVGRRIPHARRGLRANLHRECERISLEAERAVGTQDLELVELTGADVRDEELPHAAGAHRAHRHEAPVPAIEVADDPDAPGVRSPDREAHALDALVRPRVRAEHVVQPFVRPLADEVQVDLAKRRAEPIRVVQLPRVAVRELEADAVRELSGSQVGDVRGPQAVADPFHRRRGAVRCNEGCGAGIGVEGSHHRPTTVLVGPENRVRVVVLAASEPVRLVRRRCVLNRRHRVNDTRSTGMDMVGRRLMARGSWRGPGEGGTAAGGRAGSRAAERRDEGRCRAGPP